MSTPEQLFPDSPLPFSVNTDIGYHGPHIVDANGFEVAQVDSLVNDPERVMHYLAAAANLLPEMAAWMVESGEHHFSCQAQHEDDCGCTPVTVDSPLCTCGLRDLVFRYRAAIGEEASHVG